MKPNYLLFTIFTFATFFSGCKKENTTIDDGTYKGTFTVTYSSGTQTGQTTLVLNNGTFSCSGNPTKIPAGGSGTFSSGNGTITFNDENFWTADFDWNLILSGTYDYTFNGENLKITADKNNVGTYTYDLVKQ
jgi:hypothetical protein